MKILIIVDSFWPAVAYGGPTTVALQHARALVKAGYDVTVATSNVDKLLPSPAFMSARSDVVDGVKVHYFPSSILRPIGISPRWGALYSRTLIQWLKAHVNDFDIIHQHFSRSLLSLSAVRTIQAFHVPLVLQTHGMLDKRGGFRTVLDTALTTRILERASAVLVLQERERKLVQAIAPRANTILLPNGIDASAVVVKWMQPKSKPRALFIGRLHPRKRPQDFIEMAKLLKARDLNMEYRLIGPDEGMLSEVQAKINEYNLSSDAKWVGPLLHEEVYRELAQAQVYILPSVDEPFPMSVLEALAVGVPTVVTTNTGISDWLSAYSAAEVVPPRCPEALANAVRKIVDDPAYARQISELGQKFVTERLSLERIIEQLESIYREVAYHERFASKH
ncbi:MAG: glycosyltransferase [Firmicutes bacterium]|nr:glycosyltransferase [Bacillota bacterium]